MMWDGGFGSGVGSLLTMSMMMFFGVLFLVGIVLLIVWASRAGHGGAAGGGYHRSGAQEACDVARLRYARGEITKDQFEDMCRTLGR